MSYPVTITGNPGGFDLGGQNARGEYFVEVSPSAWYLFLRHGSSTVPGDLLFHAFKSTDFGLTWVEKDAAHAPAVTFQFTGGSSFAATQTVCRDGNTVYLVDIYGSASGGFGGTITWSGVRTWTFDLVAETWSLAPVNHTNVVPGAIARGPVPATQSAMQLIRRGAGDMVLVFHSTPEVISGGYYARISVSTFDGTAFTTPVLMPGQAGNASFYTLGRCCYDPSGSGMTHVIFWSNIDVAYCHRAWSDAGTWGAFQICDPTNASTMDDIGQGESFSDCILFNGGAQFGFVDLTDFENPTLFYAPAGSLAPTWNTIVVISTSASYVDQSFSYAQKTIAFAEVGSTLYCVWITDSPSAFPVPVSNPSQDKLPNGAYIMITAASSAPTVWSGETQIFAQTTTGGAPGGGSAFPGDTNSYQAAAFNTSQGLAVVGCGIGQLSVRAPGGATIVDQNDSAEITEVWMPGSAPVANYFDPSMVRGTANTFA